MAKIKRLIIQGDNSTYNEIHNYGGGKEIRKHLTPPPFLPEVFIGREEELAAIHQKLFSGKNLLLLVNGEGGVGKTSLASNYYHAYQDEYKHVAWVLSEKSITNAILRLASSLGLEFDPKSTAEERLPLVLQAMAGLDKPCLLVIDNANELVDLDKSYQHLRSISNFHLLLTTRVTTFHKAEFYRIEGLPYEQAFELFKEYYPQHDASEDELFRHVHTAVSGNTLVIELLAKNLQLLNQLRAKYRLKDLLADLQDKGLLCLSQVAELSTDYHSQGEGRKGRIQEIVAAMYDLGDLSEDEKALMSVFAVLPSESIQFKWLEQLLPPDTLETTLLSLAQKGWINYEVSTSSFKPSPVVQAVTRFKNKERLNRDCKSFSDHLQGKLLADATSGEFEKSNYQDLVYYAYLAESLVIPLEVAENITSMLGEQLGNYKKKSGDLHGALAHYQQNYNFKKQFIEQFPEMLMLKNGLRSTCKNLGEIYTALGDFARALHYDEESYDLEMEFHKSKPDSDGYKLNLAIASARLGETHTKLTQLVEASVRFEESVQYFEELSKNDPDEIVFQDGLAIVFFKLGETYTDLGDLQRAYLYFEACNRVENSIVIAHPNDEKFRARLATSYEQLGSTLTSLGDMDKAIDFLMEWYRLENELHQSSPGNVGYLSSLASSSFGLAESYSILGQFEKAVFYFEECSQYFKEIGDSQPDKKKALNGQAIAYFKLGEIYTSLGELQIAYTYYDRGNRIGTILLTSFPNDLDYRDRQLTSYERLANTLIELGDLQKASICLEDCNRLLKDLHKDFPSDKKIKDALAITFKNLGSIYSAMKVWKNALSCFEESTRFLQELYDCFPEDLSFKSRLAYSFCELGDSNARFNISDAIGYYDSCHKLSIELVADFPENTSYKYVLAVSCWRLGFMWKRIEDAEIARRFLTDSKNIWEELTISDPTSVRFQSNLEMTLQELENVGN